MESVKTDTVFKRGGALYNFYSLKLLRKIPVNKIKEMLILVIKIKKNDKKIVK